MTIKQLIKNLKALPNKYQNKQIRFYHAECSWCGLTELERIKKVEVEKNKVYIQ